MFVHHAIERGRQIWGITGFAPPLVSIFWSEYVETMPMQIVFPLSMVAVGVAGAGGLVVLANKMLYGKVGFGEERVDAIELPTRDDR